MTFASDPIWQETPPAADGFWAGLLAFAATPGVIEVALTLGVIGAVLLLGRRWQRLLRLVRSHDERLLDDVRAITHQLGSGGHRFDWAEVAELVLSDDTPFADWGEDVRRRICLDYYRQRAGSARGGEKEGR